MQLRTDSAGNPILPSGASTDLAETERIATETAVNGRAMLSTHPALGLGTAAGAGGMWVLSPEADDDGTTEAFPVLLLEPAQSLLLTMPGSGDTTEAQVDSICQHGGFSRYRPLVHQFSVADGWTVSRADGGVELRDQEHGLWARTELTPEPEWMSTATSQGYAMVFYGPQLGVRIPDGETERSFNDAARLADLRTGRERGFIACALVRWTG